MVLFLFSNIFGCFVLIFQPRVRPCASLGQLWSLDSAATATAFATATCAAIAAFYAHTHGRMSKDVSWSLGEGGMQQINMRAPHVCVCV